MAYVKLAFRLALAGAVVATVLAFGLPGLRPQDGAAAQATGLHLADGSPLAVPTQPGITHATWQGHKVLVYAVPQDFALRYEQAHGAGALTRGLDVAGLHVFAVSGVSTFLGCSVEPVDLAARSATGTVSDASQATVSTVLDLCHQGTWDAQAHGAHLRGPGAVALASLDLQARDGALVASAFDGPIGAQRAP